MNHILLAERVDDADAPCAPLAQVHVVDDDPSVRSALARLLDGRGWSVFAHASAESFVAAHDPQAHGCIVLDVAMPGLDGLAVARRVRAKGLPVPILFLTARDAVSDRVGGFEAGGDDYLVKPFAMAELLVRVRALLRRGVTVDESLVYRDLTLDPVLRRAHRRGREIELTEREAGLLELLIRNAGLVVSRSRALSELWDGGGASSNVVDRYVSYLRRKLGDPPLIETVRGVGFRLPR